MGNARLETQNFAKTHSNEINFKGEPQSSLDRLERDFANKMKWQAKSIASRTRELQAEIIVGLVN